MWLGERAELELGLYSWAGFPKPAWVPVNIGNYIQYCVITSDGKESQKKNMHIYVCIYISVQFSHSVLSDSLQPCGLQHARPPCPSPTPGAYSDGRPLSQWCHPIISFSSCLQSFPVSGSFPVSQFFASGGQSTGVSASASVLPINIQDWFPLG